MHHHDHCGRTACATQSRRSPRRSPRGSPGLLHRLPASTRGCRPPKSHGCSLIAPHSLNKCVRFHKSRGAPAPQCLSATHISPPCFAAHSLLRTGQRSGCGGNTKSSMLNLLIKLLTLFLRLSLIFCTKKSSHY